MDGLFLDTQWHNQTNTENQHTQITVEYTVTDIMNSYDLSNIKLCISLNFAIHTWPITDILFNQRIQQQAQLTQWPVSVRKIHVSLQSALYICYILYLQFDAAVQT